ncbi:type II toxin-antitoxin system HigB family toxin [Thalassospira marina]|uniref:Addiction module toxin RelE n=1 Tax=Thalassospira marina TaxID=2048283 RepID=A0ABM6Q6N8_9PROT|nr:type II toxin-antitoxin system HigB family toxin [Thalassospira marina]AUG52131.1 hypothetical protein CSC3H3_04865 [Thalassospira marina]
MRIIKRSSLIAFWEKHPETEQSLRAWFDRTKKANWLTTQDVLNDFSTAKVIKGERVRFKIHGNDYRLIVSFKMSAGIAWIKFIGTHEDYDKIDATTIDQF